jgi:hypothetical protein
MQGSCRASAGVFASHRQKGDGMDKKQKEKLHQKKEQEKFNSVTNSVKPENQNQSNNVKKEGFGRQNNKF